MVLIPNTLELTTLWVTPPMAAEVEAHPELAFETDFLPIPLDGRGASCRSACSPRACGAGIGGRDWP